MFVGMHEVKTASGRCELGDDQPLAGALASLRERNQAPLAEGLLPGPRHVTCIARASILAVQVPQVAYYVPGQSAFRGMTKTR